MIDLNFLKWTPITIGVIASLILGILLNIFGILFATVYVGYSVNITNQNGAIHGGLVGLIVGVLTIIFVFITGLSGDPFVMIPETISTSIIGIVLGAIGGIIGFSIRKYAQNET